MVLRLTVGEGLCRRYRTIQNETCRGYRPTQRSTQVTAAGIAQGLGQAHLEGMVYSEDWQLSTMGWAVRLTRLGVPHEFYSYPEANRALD